MNPRKKSNELVLANREIAVYKIEKAKRKAELIIVNKELDFQNKEKGKRVAELILAIKELDFQNSETEKCVSELKIANKELLFQNKEKEKRAAELIVANKELVFQNKEKEKRAKELTIADKELAFQNKEKRKRAKELVVANKKLVFQNKEKGKREKELIIADKELAFQNEEKEKRAKELIVANKELVFQNKEKGKRAKELIIADKELVVANKELEKTEDELKVTHERLLFHVDNTPLGYIEWNREGHLKYKSPKAEEIFGWTLKELLAGEKTAYDQVYAEDLPLVKKIVKQLINGEVERNRIQNRNITKDGKVIWCEWFNSVLKDKDGKVITIMSLVQNITEQKELEEDLWLSENRFRALIEKSPDMKTLSTREGKIIYGSPSVTKVLGYSLEEFIQKSILDLIHRDDIAGYAEKRKAITQTPGKSFDSQNRFLHKNGSWIWCEGTITNLLDEPGINAMVSNFIDISGKKLTELAQQENENLIQTIYAASLDAVIIIDEEGIIRKWDTKSESLFGWEEREMIGMKLSETIIPERYREMHINGIKHYMATGEGPVMGKTITIGALKKTGVEFDISLSITPSRINGKTCFIGFIRDISEKKAAERQREFDSNNLDALINNTSDLMWSVDKDFNLITSNQPFDEMGKVNFGKTIAKGGNVLSASYSPEMLSHFKELYERAFAGEVFTETEYFDFPAELWTEISYYPIRKGDKVIGTACHSRDITELKKGEKDLFESEARLKEAQAIAHISNWEINLLTGVNTWSDEFYNIMGVNRDDVQPSPEAFLSFIHPDDTNRVGQMIKKAYETFENSFFYSRAKTHDGSIKYIYSEYRFEFDNTGKPIRLYGILQDVTEQRNAEDKIKHSESRFREFFDSAPEGIVIIDLNTMSFPKFNDNALKLLKYSGEELIKKGPADVSPPFQPDGRATEEKARELIMKAVNGEKLVFEWLLIDGNGKEIISEVRLAPLTNVDGPQVIANFADIGERKKSEQKIIESELKYRSLIEQASDTIIVVDTRGSILEINSRAERLFGYSRDELVKMKLKELLFAEDATPYMDDMANGKTVVYERKLKRKGGAAVYVEVSARLISDGTILGIFRDISERIKTLEERDRLTADIVQRNKDLEQFTYIVSHNLRAPVANILGASNRLNDPRLTAGKKDVFARGIKESVLRLDTVINDLNLILQVKHSIAEIKEKVRFSELVEEIKISIKDLIDSHDIEIKYDFSELDEFLTLKSYVYSIFYNLISNSIKYRQEQVHTFINIKSHRVKNKIELIFTDNGTGIDLQKKGEQVFGLYKRFHTNIKGKGMGLFMVKAQVETLGGKIGIRSEINKGAELKIEFDI